MTLDDVTHEYANVNGIRMHYARAGKGPLIVFLHGFPQCWYEFRRQLAEFSGDHLAVSADLRGYNLSGKPEQVRDCGVLCGVEDLRQLVVDHLGYEKFVLIGHDWGGAVGWSFALHHPELLDRLVILSTAHPALLERELRENPDSSRQAGTTSPSASQAVSKFSRPTSARCWRCSSSSSTTSATRILPSTGTPGAAGGAGWDV